MMIHYYLFILLLPILSLAAPILEPAVALAQRETSALSFEESLSLEFSGGTPTAPLKARATLTEMETGLTTDACKALTFIFARGTSEPGNVGDRVGPQVIADLRSTLGTAQVTAQGVNYSASILGYLEGGDPAGTKEMTRLVNLAYTKCPSTKIALGGYSQGAQVLHNTAAALSAVVSARIVAVVMFGDPDYGQAVGTVPSSKVDSICHPRDIICTKTGDFTTHLTYDVDAPAAAAFIVSESGL